MSRQEHAADGPQCPARVYLSVGSNLGDREFLLREALRLLDSCKGIRLTKCSRIFETEPIGVADQPVYLNLAAEIETALAPLELLNVAKEIEARLGRGETERWGPRFLDIDIILWGEKQLSTPRLTLPHPEFRNRAFVLGPLAEIAPEAVDPVSGRQVRELAVAHHVQGQIEPYSPVTP